jgi:alpha-D-ribose 1-methylphosphonate 5-triphosphate synthase subunit PhnG
MAILARAHAEDIERLLAATASLPLHVRLRGPETGLVMTRGRAGGGGPAFNLGEMTVTRCTVRAATGQVGHAYIAGRDLRRAELAARVDAALQDPALHDALQQGVIAALEADQLAARVAVARRAAATRVQFFTMTTMRE